jgi:hypothetical protein
MTKKLLSVCLMIARHNLPKHTRLDGYKHFSFIIQKNWLVDWGTNRSGPPLKMFGYQEHQMIHSENQAYKRAKGLLDKTDTFQVVNIRLNSKGEVKNSKPCQCCINFLNGLGCNSIWFSTTGTETFSKILL